MVRISEKELLTFLIRNARIPYTHLAKKLGVSEGAVRKKIKLLEKKGVIKGYYAKIDCKKIGYKIDALIGIDTRPDGFLNVIEALKKNDKVLQLWTSTGDHMIMFRAWFKDNDELLNFTKRLKRMKEITRICPAILIEEVK